MVQLQNVEILGPVKKNGDFEAKMREFGAFVAFPATEMAGKPLGVPQNVQILGFPPQKRRF